MATAQKAKSKPLPALDAILNLEALRQLGGPKTFERGKNYFEEGRVEVFARERSRFEARVRGSQPYLVKIWAEGKSVHASCTCPAAIDGRVCKHVIAAGLAWLDGHYRKAHGFAEGLDEAVNAMEGMLEGQPDELVELTENAMTLAKEALQQFDDPDGEMSAALERLRGLHRKACEKARAPVLAK